MWNSSNTEKFIEKAKTIHSDKYDYSLTNYIKWDEKVRIVCKIHGEFEQTPNGHLCGRGCRKCGTMAINIIVGMSKEDFLIRAYDKHKNLYDYSKIDFINKKQEVTVVCKVHGDIRISPEVHLRTCGCQKCGEEIRRANIKKDTKHFIKKANELWKKGYTYSNTEYVDSTTKIVITCEKHGDFEKLPSNFLKGSGCPICGNERKSRRDTGEDFIKKAKATHGDLYNYSKVEYIKSNKKVKIICKNHGEFLQTPNNHLSEYGCLKCANDKQKENSCNWSYSGWEETSKKSKDFDSFKVYIVKCWNNEEEFYKIGKTFLTVKKRLTKLSKIHYNWEIINFQVFSSAKETSEKEAELHKLNKKYKYTPNIEFGGMYECYNLDLPVDEIINSYHN